MINNISLVYAGIYLVFPDLHKTTGYRDLPISIRSFKSYKTFFQQRQDGRVVLHYRKCAFLSGESGYCYISLEYDLLC